MKVFGRTIKSTVLGGLSIQREMFTKANGLTEFLMEKANASIPTVHHIKGNGEIINRMVRVMKSMKTAHHFEEIL